MQNKDARATLLLLGPRSVARLDTILAMIIRSRAGSALIVFAFVAAACSGSAVPAATPSVAPATMQPAAGPDPVSSPPSEAEVAGGSNNDGSRYQVGDSSYIFDDDELRTYELNLAAADLVIIDADPAAEQYVEGTLSFEGETLPVGIRYKGSIGAFVNCLSGTDVFNPSGSKTCVKLSMKIKINWTDTDDTFYGLKKLQFHSQNIDPTAMHERLGYWLFREMGVPAPRSVHARVVVNGELVGLFGLTEQIDGRFARENFADGTGNLYKEVWPVPSNDQPVAATTALGGLKTNEDEDPNVDLIVGFAADLAGAARAEVPEVLRRWIDVEQTLAYAVVDRAIANDDGVMHFYCSGGERCGPHNFYWYEDPSTQLLHLIPWDLDNAFENIAGPTNPVTPIADGWGETTNNCDPFVPPGSIVAQRSAACDPIWGALATMETEFDEIQRAFLAGTFSAELVDDRLDVWSEQIAGAMAEAADAHPGAVSVAQWEQAVDRLRLDLEMVRAALG